MTTPPYTAHGSATCPWGATAAGSRPTRPLPIHGDAFSADPHATYALLRRSGSIAPVEIAPGVHGYLTTTYRAALSVLRSTPAVFAKDPTDNWGALIEGRVPEDSPARMMMMPRRNALWMDGAPHTRLRGAITDSLAAVDTHALEALTAHIADWLLDRVAAVGGADLAADYADQLPMLVLMRLFDCPTDLVHRIVTALTKLFDTDQDSARANADLEAACLELVQLKRRRPGTEVTSRLLAHPACLADEEMVQQLLLMIGAGATPSSNLIINTLKLLLSDDRFAGSVLTGVRPVSEALDFTLWHDAPVANYSPLYARHHVEVEGTWVRPGYPVMVSFAAANTDPTMGASADRTGNRAHLAFSAGAHACPAVGMARVISQTAIERALDRLPGLALGCPEAELRRRPGTFTSGWLALPVTFAPSA
ncbi:cytochrome P450 [Kitasatospora sp. NPDC048540]|uniref:cytochrome P450 n=1 Tax=Kitasatospora sp. NPDC048540 TaxID=3155634 RepID=UPI0034036301